MWHSLRKLWKSTSFRTRPQTIRPRAEKRPVHAVLLVRVRVDDDQVMVGVELREDVVEQTWRVVQPALDSPGAVHPYFRGEWGPAQADRILDGDSWFVPS